VNNVLASGVAVQDLEQEKMDRRDGIERAVTPAMSRDATGLLDGFRAEAGAKIVPQSRENGSNAWWHGCGSFQPRVGRSLPLFFVAEAL
jgi:hypothetical protein